MTSGNTWIYHLDRRRSLAPQDGLETSALQQSFSALQQSFSGVGYVGDALGEAGTRIKRT